MNMKKFQIIVIALLLACAAGSRASGTSRLVTDRDIYVSGDELLLSVWLPDNCDFKVLYLGLTDASGKAICGVNLPVSDFRSAGHLYLPDSLQSGSYLVTAFSPHRQPVVLANKEIVVLNRFVNTEEHLSLSRGQLSPVPALPVSEWRFGGLSPAYRPGQEVELRLENSQPVGQADLLTVCVSRCPENWPSLQQTVPAKAFTEAPMTREQGITIRGQVRFLADKKPAAGAIVYLSIPDSIPFFDYYQTASDGAFYFVLPGVYGVRELVLQAELDDQNENLELLVQNNAEGATLSFKTQPVEWTTEWRTFMNESVNQAVFRKIFRQTDLDEEQVTLKLKFPFPFYGSAAMKVDPDEFFELGDFSEIARELLPAVRFRNRKGDYKLDVVDYEMKGYLSGKPMVLVDGVPVTDLSRIAPMGTKQIDWVDMVPYQRFYGDLKMDGVVAIYTKEGGASALPESPRLLKQKAETLQPPFRLTAAKPAGTTEPDFRSLLFWEPAISPVAGKKISFRTPDVAGTYRVYLLERTADGQLHERTDYFTVNNPL